MIKIEGLDNRSPNQELSYILQKAMLKLNEERKQTLSDPMQTLTQEHITQKYPGSKHWDPNKIYSILGRSYEGICDIDVPGATRNYRDVDIYPKKAESLTIPLHRAAYGVPAGSISGLFRPKGKNILAKIMNGALVAFYALSKHVHQVQDDTLLPTDQSYLEAVAASVVSELEKNLE